MGSTRHTASRVTTGMVSVGCMLAAQNVSADDPEPPAPQVSTTLEDARFLSLVGDSITYGTTNDPSLPGDVSVDCFEGQCYAALLRAKLDAAHEAEELPEIRVINIGIGGATTRDYDPTDYDQEDAHFLANGLFLSTDGRPLFYNIPLSRYAIIYLGTNDAVGYFEPSGIVSPEEYEAHLYDIIRTMIRHKVKFPMLVTPPIPASWQDEPAGDLMREYATAIKRICDRFGPRRDQCLIDLQDGYPDSEWYGDFVHPTLAGHEWIAESIYEHIEMITGSER